MSSNNDEASKQRSNADAVEGDLPTEGENNDSDDTTHDWIDPFPRPRRKDDAKDAKKKKKQKKKEKKSAYFGIGEDLGAVGVDTNDVWDSSARRRGRLLRAPSVDYLPPPPRDFSLNAQSQTGNEGRKRDTKTLQIYDEYDRPNRPGVLRVRNCEEDDGGGDVEVGVPSITDLTSIGSSNNQNLLDGGRGYDQPLPPSSSIREDITAPAELVTPVVAAAPDSTDELRERVRMLEEDKAQREERGKYNKAIRARILWAFGLLLAVAGAAVGITIFVTKNKRSQSATEAPSRAPTPQPSQHPTLFPTFSPTPLPTVDVEELWTALIQSESPATTFDNTTSPQYRALEWMVQDPLTNSLFNDTDRVLQRFALVLFWYATGASLGGGWLRDANECAWGGTSLRCDSNGNVVGIETVELVGTIPKELGLLSLLSHLVLGGKNFEGTIPSEIGRMTSLTHLDLSYADFQGSLPSEIGLLTRLNELFMLDTSVAGSIPTEIGKLTSVTLLDLSYSDFEGGTLPSEIGLLTRLSLLYLVDTSLGGLIPTEIGVLSSSLESVAFHKNKLNGTLPSEIGLLTSMTWMDLSVNALTGTIPSEVAKLTKLELFKTYGNEKISGTIPSSLCSAEHISIDCENVAMQCTCCVGPWPNFIPCADPSDVFG